MLYGKNNMTATILGKWDVLSSSETLRHLLIFWTPTGFKEHHQLSRSKRMTPKVFDKDLLVECHHQRSVDGLLAEGICQLCRKSQHSDTASDLVDAETWHVGIWRNIRCRLALGELRRRLRRRQSDKGSHLECRRCGTTYRRRSLRRRGRHRWRRSGRWQPRRIRQISFTRRLGSYRCRRWWPVSLHYRQLRRRRCWCEISWFYVFAVIIVVVILYVD